MTTIYDIAKAAGVTATTVSNVLSGKGSVSAATRARVLKLVQELQYTPNLVARSLIKGHTGVIGFVVPSITNDFYAETTATVERLAYARGLRVFMTTLSGDDQDGRELLKDLALRRVDGILMMGGTVSPQIILSLGDDKESYPPVVYCIWEGNEEAGTLAVKFDFFRAGQMAAEHLLALGHRNIGIIVHINEDSTVAHYPRLAGFQAALQGRGYPLDPALIEGGRSDLESGKVAARRLLALPEPPTAIFATNDLMAIGAMSAAWEAGLHIPQDLSLIGMDDIAFSRYTTPPLTTVVIDKLTLMAKAIDILLHVIKSQPVPTLPVFQPALAERGSTRSFPYESHRVGKSL